jgi:ribosomal protein S27AE
MSQLENEQTFAETGVEELSNIIMTLSLDGGKKKKKRKPHTTPKVIPHKHVTIKMRTLNYFEVTKDGKVNKLKKESNTNAGCYLADHKDTIDSDYRDEIVRLAKDMKKADLRSFASTSRAKLPDRVPENNTTATVGSVNGMGPSTFPQGDSPGSGLLMGFKDFVRKRRRRKKQW